jgi:predicted transcriptional regulator
VTLKLPAKLKVRIARAAKQKGQSTQRWMREALEHDVERRERFLAYVKQAQYSRANLGPVEEIDARNSVRCAAHRDPAAPWKRKTSFAFCSNAVSAPSF